MLNGAKGQLLHFQAVMSSQQRQLRSTPTRGPQKLPSPRPAHEIKSETPRATTALHRHSRRITQHFRQPRPNMPSTFDDSDLVPSRYISPPRSPPPSANTKRCRITDQHRVREFSVCFCLIGACTSFLQIPEIIGGFKASNIKFVANFSGNAKQACLNPEIEMCPIAIAFGEFLVPK